jgi:inosine-uridine nucleoside N-ribohydrolase
MRSLLRFLPISALVAFLVAPLPELRAVEPVKLILDTDIGNDIDDAFALALIHALQNRGEVQLLAVTITKDNKYAAPFVDLENTFYGRPEIPIGVVHDGKTRDTTEMLREPVERRKANGQYAFPRRVGPKAEPKEAVVLLREVLSAQPDASVTIAQIGFSTNLAHLLKSEGGRQLVQRKVRLLVIMAGWFGDGAAPEYNVKTDGKAAKELFAEWPTPMIFSGFELGRQVMIPYAEVQKDFNYAANHPVAESFKVFAKPGEDRANYDSTAVLQAVRPDRDYFELSPPGRVTLASKDVTVFTPDPQGNARYMILRPENCLRVQELLVALSSEPPQEAAPIAAASHRVQF